MTKYILWCVGLFLFTLGCGVSPGGAFLGAGAVGVCVLAIAVGVYEIEEASDLGDD